MDVRPAIEVVAARHHELSSWLHARFPHKLTREDCDDLVQDALLSVLDATPTRALTVPQIDLWVRKAANNKAVDVVRSREGRGRIRRPTPTDIATVSDTLADERPEPAVAVEHQQAQSAEARELRSIVAKLSPTDAEILTLRHVHQLPVVACAKHVGLPKTKYERRHTTALRRLRELLIRSAPTEACWAVRHIIDRSRLHALHEHDIGRRDAHVAGCMSCRAYERRDRRLLTVGPLILLAPTGTLEHLAARVVAGQDGPGDWATALCHVLAWLCR